MALSKMPCTRQMTRHHPSVGGLRNQNNSVCTAPSKCPPGTLAHAGTSMARASEVRTQVLGNLVP